MAKDARSVILRHRREALRAAEEENRALLGDEGRRHAAWPEIQRRAAEGAQNKALEELGIQPASLNSMEKRETSVSLLGETDELPPTDDPSVGLEQAVRSNDEPIIAQEGPERAPSQASATDQENEEIVGTATGRDSDTLSTYEFVVAPGAQSAPPEVLIEKEHIPQKWVRVPIDFGTLTIDLAKDSHSLEAAVAEFNASMVRQIDNTISAWESDDRSETGGQLWGFAAGSGTRSRTITPQEVVSWEGTLDALRRNRRIARPVILPILEFENLDDPVRADERTIRIILANESDLLDPDQAAARETDASLYQVEMAVAFEPELHRPIGLERIEPSYRYNRYLTHDALGINCGVRRRALVEPNILETTALPIYFQPLIEQFEITPPPEFEKLGGEDGGLDVLHALLHAYDHWLDDVILSKPYARALDPVADADDYNREKQQFENVDLPGWRTERDAIARGIRVIESAVSARKAGKPYDDPEVIPLTAWQFMNQTFQYFWSVKNKNVKSWRLFQVAFIVSQIPAIASRLDVWKNDATVFRADDDREAALLYFSTGSGKSESFFGLLVFSVAFDRLRGKERGISAVIRYPLRLLTSQQAFRLSQVLAAAYRTRWAWKERGIELRGYGFDIGFWVGGNNTPNNPNARGMSEIPRRSSDWGELESRRGDYAIYLKKWARLPSCPFCNEAKIGLRRFQEGPDERLGHFCFNRDCEWNRRHHVGNAGPYPLPLHIMDSDIYAHTPAVLLGTVDKLALIGQSARTIARVMGMFGFPAWHHPGTGRLVSPSTREQFRKGPQVAGCEPVWPFYREGKKLFLDPYPLLEIQDEAHLLDESLGTFSGLFETTFHHALRTLAPLLGDTIPRNGQEIRPPRIVAASATVSEPERQIDQIYQRAVSLFPKPGPDLYESFYARLHRPLSGDAPRDGSGNAEHRAPTRRRYISLMTNGRTHTAATVAVLSAYHLTISQMMKRLIEGDDGHRWAVRNEMANSLPSDVFQSGHRNILLDPIVSHDDIAGAVDLNRIALLYVTNKKGGDNVKAALQDVLRRDHRLAGLSEIPGVKTSLITGAIDAGLIGAIVTEASRKTTIGVPFSMETLRDSLRCVIATSAISHGVDVDEFNMMFFAGQPADIAEYIQASSRVGRTHVGTSVLIPTPQQRRDRYIVEIHDIFHRFLERMIDAAPVERWAEMAINRTLASFLQLKLCGVDYIKNMHGATTAVEKASFAEPDNVGEIGERSRTDHIRLVEELRQFVVDGVGLYHATSPLNKDFYERRIHDLFDKATTAMEQSNWRAEVLDSFFRQSGSPLARPMTSLRDVNEAGVIEGGFGTGSDRIKRGDIGRVMSALMRGNNIWTAGDAGE
jgi:hypothetical protein